LFFHSFCEFLYVNKHVNVYWHIIRLQSYNIGLLFQFSNISLWKREILCLSHIRYIHSMREMLLFLLIFTARIYKKYENFSYFLLTWNSEMFSFLNMTINFQFWQKKLQSLVETFKVRLLYYAESKIITLIILAFIYNILPRFIIHTCTSLYAAQMVLYTLLVRGNSLQTKLNLIIIALCD